MGFERWWEVWKKYTSESISLFLFLSVVLFSFLSTSSLSLSLSLSVYQQFLTIKKYLFLLPSNSPGLSWSFFIPVIPFSSFDLSHSVCLCLYLGLISTPLCLAATETKNSMFSLCFIRHQNISNECINISSAGIQSQNGIHASAEKSIAAYVSSVFNGTCCGWQVQLQWQRVCDKTDNPILQWRRLYSHRHIQCTVWVEKTWINKCLFFLWVMRKSF